MGTAQYNALISGECLLSLWRDEQRVLLSGAHETAPVAKMAPERVTQKGRDAIESLTYSESANAGQMRTAFEWLRSCFTLFEKMILNLY